MKKSGKIIAYSIAIFIVIVIAVSIVAIYHMGYSTAHYREKDINTINQTAFDDRHDERSEHKDIIISKEEAIKNYYDKDSVFDIDIEDYETVKWVLKSSFPKEIITNGEEYEVVESSNTSAAGRIISMYPIERYFRQYLGVWHNDRKTVLVYLTTEYTPEYVGQYVQYKGLPPDELTVTIDLTTEKLSL